jgi:pimeloyl-ACP methyl ester carboxylesterase
MPKSALALGLACALALATPALATEKTRASITTNDGAVISYWEAGAGQPIVMLPGWSQTADQFDAQLPLARTHRLIAVDLRGHGESSKIDKGYRIHRLAMDLRQLLEQKGLEGVTLLGHSMGASVMWAYWELFGRDRVSRFVIVDQVPSCAYNPSWSPAERAATGALWDYNTLAATADRIRSADARAVAADFVNNAFFTAAFPQERKGYVLAENLKLPRDQGARLIFDHCSLDWRDVIPTIDVPVLIVGGEKSIFRVEALQWIRDAIPGSRLEVFSEADGGSHFMFMENPARFNALIESFVPR